MEADVARQGSVFVACLLLGVASGVVFDCFRILRRGMQTGTALTNVCDALFWTTYALLFLWWMFRVNDGELRWYVFFSCLLGAVVYFLLISRFFVKSGVFLLRLLVKVMKKTVYLVFYPVKFLAVRTGRAAVFVFAPLKRLRIKKRSWKRFFANRVRLWHLRAKKI